MKYLLLLMSSVFILSSCVNKSEVKAKNLGQEIYFESTNFDFGPIEEDSDTIYSISFKNLGEEAIIINRVRSSCGCTIPTWPRKPVEPNASGEIQVKYNTALPGSYMKSIYVYSSAANSPVKLIVKGKVIPKEKTE